MQDRLDYRPARTPCHGNSGEESDCFTATQQMGFHTSKTEECDLERAIPRQLQSAISDVAPRQKGSSFVYSLVCISQCIQATMVEVSAHVQPPSSSRQMFAPVGLWAAMARLRPTADGQGRQARLASLVLRRWTGLRIPPRVAATARTKAAIRSAHTPRRGSGPCAMNESGMIFL